MSVVDFNDKTIESEVFRFVSVRNPQRITTIQHKRIAAPYDTSDPSNFYEDIVEAISDPTNETEALKLAACKTLATTFKEGDDWLVSSADLEAMCPTFVGLYDWLQANITTLTVASFTAKVTGIELDSTGRKRIWDNLFARLILGGDGALRTALIETLVIDHMLANYLDEEVVASDADLRMMVNAKALLPEAIFPLPGTTKATGTATSNTEEPEDPAEMLATLSQHRAAILELDELRLQLEESLFALPPLSEVNVEVATNPETYPHTHFALTTETIAGLTTGTQDILEQYTLGAGTRLSHCLQTVERKLGQLHGAFMEGREVGRRVVAMGGGIWEPSPAREGDQGDCDSTKLPDLGSDYGPFYGGNDDCRIRPLGIGDLLLVQQKLCCYAPGEVAHIENILQGEYKERATRRLHRVEETFISVTEKETLDERDSITTEQHEMENTSSTVVQEDIALNIGMVAGYHGPTFDVTLNSGFATSTATNTASQSATVYAKSVTTRALQRIVERRREERIRRVIDEYEETTKHGLDNRGGSDHVVGLYRWADKIYEAKLVNYGKRLMFEFLVPEPATFHRWAMSKPSAGSAVELVEPVNPRTGVAQYGLPPLSEKGIYRPDWNTWGALYSVPLDPPPAKQVTVSHSHAAPEVDGNGSVAIIELTVPKGYKAKEVHVSIAFRQYGSVPSTTWVTLQVGPHSRNLANSAAYQYFPIMHQEVNFVPVSVIGGDLHHLAVNMTMVCDVLDEYVTEWQKGCYEKILAAYNAQKAAYDEALAQAKAGFGSGLIGTNPALNRQIERTELRKACINALFYGADFSSDSIANYGSEQDCQPPIAMTDCCAVYEGERAKFLEQVFDWNFMSYVFYPYFHGKRCRWKMLHQLQDADLDFLKFLQAGMARVLVPVRLGFEEVAMQYLSTGEIWGGGPVPAIKSDLYLSIVQELMGAVMYTGEDVSPTWEIRVPTTLTVLQCGSACISGSGLPCECGTGIGGGTPGVLTAGSSDPVLPGSGE